jgi:hypothetical protein
MIWFYVNQELSIEKGKTVGFAVRYAGNYARAGLEI